MLKNGNNIGFNPGVGGDTGTWLGVFAMSRWRGGAAVPREDTGVVVGTHGRPHPCFLGSVPTFSVSVFLSNLT